MSSPVPNLIARSWVSRPLLAFVLTLTVPILLVMFSVRLLMTETYLQIEYNKPDFPPDTYGYSLADRLYYAPIAIRYLESDSGIELLGDLKKPDGTPFYNQRELEHMLDVKVVVRAAFSAMNLILLAFVLVGLLLRSTPAGRRRFWVACL